ncbi:MAG: carboxypeptidase regulatory-like domain-containing protein [Acidobacteria bacterium]|nr:carboxypeptidase regulatory-like domain-containing protein [Acidobacteriota bacterium]
MTAKGLFLIPFSILALTGNLTAQVAAKLEGTVQDQSGAVIAGAKVTTVNTKTQQKFEAQSSTEGQFVFPVVPPGIYDLTVEASGFRRAVLANIEINVSATVSQIVKLEVGQTTESITVEAQTAVVQTTDSQISRVVNVKDIDILPQLARTPILLAAYQPGVSTNPGDPSFSRINGTRQGSNNSRLDGIDVNDSVVPRLGLSLTANNSDSVGEFRVVLNGGSAEYGRNAGGTVDLVTRGGTNQFHGNAFDYLRNTALNANQFFSNQSGAKVPKLVQNQFGGSFGGRIIRNKTFFFGNFQRRDTRQETVRNRTVLRPEAKSGIFRYNAGGAVQSFNVLTADPLRLGIDKETKKLFDMLPAPNNSDLGDGLNTAGFRFNAPSSSYEDQFTIRGDHNITDNHRAFLRWSWQRNSFIDTLNNADAPFPGGIQGTQGGKRWGYAIGSNWNLTPTMVNEARFGYQSAQVAFNRPGRVAGAQLLPNLYTNPILPNFAQGRNSPVIQISDSITKVHGSHTFKGGFDYRRTKQYGYNDAGIYPNVSLATGNGNLVASTVGPQGLSAADRTRFDQFWNDVFGRMSNVTQTYYSDLTKFQGPGTPRVRNFVLREGGGFIQDDWRIRRNLTLNIGLRYEYFAVPTERDSLQGVLDRADQVNSVTQIDNLTIKRTNSYYNSDRNNFAPRIGLAWDVRGDGRTAVRANYGIFYDRQIGATVSLADGNTPGFSTTSQVFPNQAAGSDVRAGAGVPATPQPAAPVLTLPTTRNFSVVVFNPNLRTGYVQSFSLSVQRELSRGTIMEVAYVGTRGVKLFMNRDLNQQRVNEDFMRSFKELQAFQSSGAAPSANNTLVRLYGTPAAAISTLGANNFTQGRAGTVATALDTNSSNFNRYAAAGVSNFYLRNFPQFNQFIYGNNNGRSYYNSMQLSVRRNVGAVRLTGNYTFSRSIDNISVDGNGFTNVIDNNNLLLNRGRSDADRPHVFNANGSYIIPIGKGKRFGGDMGRAADAVVGGWEMGGLLYWQTGSTFTVSSQRATTSGQNTWANYSGDRNIGAVERRGDGVYFFPAGTLSSFGYPVAGEIGNSGRNSFRDARYFNIDITLQKRFKIIENHTLLFRTEAFNLLNNVNFTGLSTNMDAPASFGRFSGTTAARTMQMALRYEF